MAGRPGAGRATKWHLSTTTANTESQYSSRHTATSVGNRKAVTRQGRRDREKGRESGNHTIPCVRLWVWWWWLWTLWREGAGRARFLLPLLFTHFLHSVGLVRHTHTFAPNSLFTLCHAALPTRISRISPNPHFSCNGLLLCLTVSALPLHSNPKRYRAPSRSLDHTFKCFPTLTHTCIPTRIQLTLFRPSTHFRNGH